MKNLKLMAFLMLIFFVDAEIVYADVNEPAVMESDYVLSAGGVSDGEYIWTIPFETGSFSKIDMKSGKKENLSKISNFKELQELSGYASGAVHINAEGEKFLYLVPSEFSKPLVRINLISLKIEYPFRNVGYYFGSCHIVSESGKDYLWLFPGKVKPRGAEEDTKIVVLNLTEGKRERSISTKISNTYYSFADTIKVNENIWLLPDEKSQPIIVLDTRLDISSLDLEVVKKIYSGNDISFSKISTGAFDGNSMWLVCEDISYALNNCILVRCDQKGNFIERYALSKERFVNAFVRDKNIYLFAGAVGKKPSVTKLNIDKGDKTIFEISEKYGYIPSSIFAHKEESKDSVILVLPNTVDGKKLPLLRLIPKPNIAATFANTEEKIYRDYGDFSKGSLIKIAFDGPFGFSTSKIGWIVSGSPFEGKENDGELQPNSTNTRRFEIRSEKIKSTNELTILAECNGYYRFFVEYESEDNKEMLYADCDMYIDNIYERLPIKITRYDINSWSNDSLIENVTHSKDFGAAFSFDGSSFIKTDAPMELIPAKEVFSDGNTWEIVSPASCIISFDRDTISTNSYFAELEFNYSEKMTEVFNENEMIEKSYDGNQIAPIINHASLNDNEITSMLDNENIHNAKNDTRVSASIFDIDGVSAENSCVIRSGDDTDSGMTIPYNELMESEISVK